MKKYNSIKEMEEDKMLQKDNWNEKCIQAMTDEELAKTLFFVNREIRIREQADDEEFFRRGTGN